MIVPTALLLVCRFYAVAAQLQQQQQQQAADIPTLPPLFNLTVDDVVTVGPEPRCFSFCYEETRETPMEKKILREQSKWITLIKEMIALGKQDEKKLRTLQSFVRSLVKSKNVRLKKRADEIWKLMTNIHDEHINLELMFHTFEIQVSGGRISNTSVADELVFGMVHQYAKPLGELHNKAIDIMKNTFRLLKNAVRNAGDVLEVMFNKMYIPTGTCNGCVP